MLILLNGLSKIKGNVLQVKYVRFQNKFMFLTHSSQENNWFTTNDSKNIQDRYNRYLPANRDEAKKGDKLHTNKNEQLNKINLNLTDSPSFIWRNEVNAIRSPLWLMSLFLPYFNFTVKRF